MLDEAAAAGVRATTYKLSPSAATLAVLTRMFDAGDLRVHLDRIVPFEKVAEAHRLIDEGHTAGKIAIEVARE
ncbi:MAG: zinc-binding dehydrogenase [Microcella sp.]|nr:zinc-binding dehydrogenase [Microcella sp.]